MSAGSSRDVAIFTEALQLPVRERVAYLEKASAGDEELRKRVLELLNVQNRVGDFLETPALGASAANDERQDSAPGEKPGERIGRYKLLQQIGEGGCGVVFMADQDEPVRRKVALKIVKPGMDTRSVIARFEAERQALALMDHPNIAKVFDAGATESGRPYFVMELIRGVKITEYCDSNSLSTPERLSLFVQVCHAIQYAHQKGLIHRDIKPSNILVTTTPEGVSLPVIIDFGIAKATTPQQLTDKTLFTAFEMLIGTPAYMSPEQATLSNADVDTRTDIYSLGVLLYELLTGSTPFESKELLKAGFDEIRRVIREQEPIRPSTRLGKMTSADLTSIAHQRNSDAPKLIRAVSGDLDCIALKALEKDRNRRYETANGLALDVRRFLANEPISARPPSKFYRFQKTFLRNKLLFVGIGVIAILLVASLIVVSASWARERQARREADRDKLKAQQATAFLEDMLRGVGPSIALGKDTAILREMLDRTVDRVGSDLGDQPAVEAELRNFIGRLFQEIGDYLQAEKMHREALAINKKIFGSSREVADTLHDLGEPLRYLKLAEAESVDIEALKIRRQLFGNEHPKVASSLGSLALVYMQLGRNAEAEAYGREALRIRQKVLGAENLQTADSQRTLAIVFGVQGRWAESEKMMREILATRRKLLGAVHPSVAASLTDLAWAIGGTSPTAEAISLEREALAMRQKLLPPQHPDIAKSLFLLGDRMRAKGNLEEAHAILTAAFSLQREQVGEGDPASLETLRSLGSALEAQGKLAEAEETHRKALALWQKRGESQTPQAVGQLESLVRVLKLQRKFGEAETLLDENITPSVARQAFSANVLALRIELKTRRGLWQAAASDAAHLFELRPGRIDGYCTLAALLAKSGDHSAYEKVTRKLLALHATTTNIFEADAVAKACLFMPSPEIDLKAVGRLSDLAVTVGAGDQGALPFFQVCKAFSEYRQGHFDEAIEWGRKPLQSAQTHSHSHAYGVLSLAYARLGRLDEARTMLSKGEAMAPRIMPQSIAVDPGPGDAWLAWLFARVWLDEASSFLDGTGPPENSVQKP
jgi:serine/threonine protein kinase/Tfp pilus assembly protein PilF